MGQKCLSSDARVSREIVFPPFVPLVGYRCSTVFHALICWFEEAPFLTTPLLPRLSILLPFAVGNRMIRNSLFGKNLSRKEV